MIDFQFCDYTTKDNTAEIRRVEVIKEILICSDSGLCVNGLVVVYDGTNNAVKVLENSCYFNYPEGDTNGQN